MAVSVSDSWERSSRIISFGARPWPENLQSEAATLAAFSLRERRRRRRKNNKKRQARPGAARERTVNLALKFRQAIMKTMVG